MNNNSNLSKGIVWTILLPGDFILTFEDSLSPNIEPDYEPKKSLFCVSMKKTHKSRPNNEHNILLLDVLQDFYYVTHFEDLHKNDNKIYERLYCCDECWSLLNAFWRELLLLIKENGQYLNDERNYESAEYKIIRYDNEFKKFIYDLKEPFITRYHVYKLFKPIYSIYNPKINHSTDILFNIKDFQEFWNFGIYLLSFTLFKIQIASVNELKQLLKKITKEKIYYQFRRKYIHRNSCFSLTRILLKGNKKKDLLCFSGIDRDDINNETIKKAIDKIMRSSIFSNSYLVSDSDDIRYYLSKTKYITYGDAKFCKRKYGLKYEYRMFSCCERKTIADFCWDNCLSFEMFVKYKPCELCKYPINEFKKKYNGNIYHGIRCKPLKREKKEGFQEKASKIYNMIYKT
jgi:hypothetical protein